MRLGWGTIALALALLGASRSEAQIIVRDGLPGWAGAGNTPAQAVAFGDTSSYSVPYSYYAAWPNWPARQYVPYGASDIFPFHGRPYGRPYDLWTWPYMSTPFFSGALARYYYPPVR
jgi:hypothetical protein